MRLQHLAEQKEAKEKKFENFNQIFLKERITFNNKKMKTIKKIISLSTILGVIFIISSLVSSCNEESCCGNNSSDIVPNGECWISDCRLENNKLPYPNPVKSGGTIKLDLTCGAILRNMQFVNITYKVYVCSLNGQLVSSTTVGPIPSNSNIQQIPVLTNVSFAAGEYFLTVIAELSSCGTKRVICNSKIVVI